MKQISTGTGLCVLGLGIAVLGAAQLVGSKGNEAMAQTSGDRRIVSASVFSNANEKWGYRIWSDSSIEMKLLSYTNITSSDGMIWGKNYKISDSTPFKNWTQIEN